MFNKINVSRMQESDITQSLRIWEEQYKNYCNNKSYPNYWGANARELITFLKKKIQSKNAFVAKKDNKVIGYLTYDEFPFNGERTIFFPAIAHSAIEKYKEKVYLVLYKTISKECVDRDIFNHMWTINYNDDKLKNILFDLGFGAYAVDAFTGFVK